MIQVDNHGKKGYCLVTDCDPLEVQVGYGHYARKGEKDMVTRMTAYEPDPSGAWFLADTFRGSTARVRVQLVAPAAFRLQLFPEGVEPVTDPRKEVLSPAPYEQAAVTETDDSVLISTERLTVRVDKCPWKISALLDGAEVLSEQIRDQDVGLKYKSVPLGFTRAADGSVADVFETMYMHCDENYYGFGEKFTDFSKRGQRITVWQRDAQSTNSDYSYKGMPYFMSDAGYSVLVNTFTRTHFNMGATSGVSYTMEAEDPYLDLIFFCNRDYKGLLRDYTELSGRSPMIPRWALGFWMSKMSYMNRAELEEVVEHMASFGMSSDVIHIDGWLDSFGPFGGTELLAFDETRFPDPEGMIRWLRERGIHLSLWMFPYCTPHSMVGGMSDEELAGLGLTREIAMAETNLFKAMRDRGFLVKNAQGEPYLFALGEGDSQNTAIAALDFTNPEFCAYLKERLKRLARMGVGVIKTDFSEEIPEDAVFYDGSTGISGHNRYTYLYSKTVFEALNEAKQELGEHALIWCRSGYAGSQKYPAHWAGDSSASRNNLASILKGGLSMGLSGVSFWGFDIGGFYNADDEGNRAMPCDEDYIRSVQMGLMAPLSRSHGQSTPREPWMYSAEAQDAFLKINKLRYRLLPYLYSTAFETTLTGLPMMRAMLLEFPEDRNARGLSAQYLLGNSLLVAPVFDQVRHDIYLPAGTWVDFHTGERIEGSKWIVSEQRIDRIPLYLRPDSAIPALAEAPMHIADENFHNLVIWMNVCDGFTQPYYDEGVAGGITAKLTGSALEVETNGMDVDALMVSASAAIVTAKVNGAACEVAPEGAFTRVTVRK